MHRVLKTSTPYIILRFEKIEDKKLFEKYRRNIGSTYRPHGDIVRLRNDLTRSQTTSAISAIKVASELRKNNVIAYAQDGRVRIGLPPNSKWFLHDDNEIKTMLIRHG